MEAAVVEEALKTIVFTLHAYLAQVQRNMPRPAFLSRPQFAAIALFKLTELWGSNASCEHTTTVCLDDVGDGWC